MGNIMILSLFNISFSSLYLRSQILGQLKVAGFIRPRGAGDIRDLNVNSSNWAVVKVWLNRISFLVTCL